MDIYYKGLKLPSNVYAETQTQGIAGENFVEIEYPVTPSRRLLANNTVIHGKTPFGLSDLQDYIEAQVKNGNIKRIMTDLEESFKIQIESGKELSKMASGINNILTANRKDINNIFNNAAKSMTSLDDILIYVRDMLSNPQIKSDLNSALHSAHIITQDINEMTGDKEFKKNIKETVINFNQLSKNAADTLNKANKTLDQFGNTSNKINDFIDDVHSLGYSGKNNIADTVQNANNTMSNVNCLTTGVSQMLSQRFLLVKLLFGKPGANLEQCKNYTKPPFKQTPYQIQPNPSSQSQSGSGCSIPLKPAYPDPNFQP